MWRNSSSHRFQPRISTDATRISAGDRHQPQISADLHGLAQISFAKVQISASARNNLIFYFSFWSNMNRLSKLWSIIRANQYNLCKSVVGVSTPSIAPNNTTEFGWLPSLRYPGLLKIALKIMIHIIILISYSFIFIFTFIITYIH